MNSYTVRKAASRFATAAVADETYPGQIYGKREQYRYLELRQLYLDRVQSDIMARRPPPYSARRVNVMTVPAAYATSYRRVRATAAQRRAGYAVTAAQNRRTGGFAGIELKFFDTAVDAVALTAPANATGGEVDPTAIPGANLCLFSPTQGTGEQNRQGRRTTMKSVQITGQVVIPIQADQAAVDNACQVFIALVHDKQTNAAQLNSEDVFTNPGAAALAASPLRDLQQSTRFNVLKTWKMSFNTPNLGSVTTTDVDQGGAIRRFEGYINLKNMRVEHVANGGTIADIQDNSLHMIAFTSSTALAPTIAYNARIRFCG